MPPLLQHGRRLPVLRSRHGPQGRLQLAMNITAELWYIAGVILVIDLILWLT
jgi:hypothetical protein